MPNLIRTHVSAFRALDGLARRPLYRSVVFLMAATACGGVAAPGYAAAVAAQVNAAAQPNTPAISQSNQGVAAPDQSSTTGGIPPNLSVTVANGQIVGSVDGSPTGNPTVSLSSTGGTGGTGLDGGASYGGAGGMSGLVTLTMDTGAGVVSSTTANAAIALTSTGGQGATAGDQLVSDIPGQPGHGGDSGGVQFGQSGSITSSNGWNGSTPGTTAVLMQANGGNAAQPLGDSLAEGDEVHAPAGGNGGNGGTIMYHLYVGDVTSAGAAITALSAGGLGGAGTLAYAADSFGGNGGVGGDGGAIQIFTGQSGAASPNIRAVGASTAATGATVPIDANGSTAQAAVMAAGIQAQSIGGLGGAGATGDGGDGHPGAGGKAGDANTVQVSIGSTNISTTGFAAAGVLAQSIGGAGGTGAGASGIYSHGGGNGGTGGDGNEVDVATWEWTATQPTSLIKTEGGDSMAVVAQSIGGGGGAGGAVQTGSAAVGVAVGGDGEPGGTGGVATLYNGYPYRSPQALAETGFVISTKGERSSALVAQSIGGGGGSGGSAQNSSVGIFNYVVGGSGGNGGSAGTAGTNQLTIYNSGIVSTQGNHAKGVVGQVVGGGGGEGGSALALNASAELNINVSVGGSGGKGGTAGDVLATNTGQILTSGSDAWGVLGQSVGDGGGNGGMSKADAYTLSVAEEVPSVAIDIGVGGKGGDGGAGGNVGAYNIGLIMTSGAGAHGEMAQSVSGGGGAGGDSSVSNIGVGTGTSVAISLAVGGTGGEGGTGGVVTADNSAGSLIFTAGDSARGIFAQSVGGGGGVGSAGKGDTRFIGQDKDDTASLTMTLGGDGGSGAAGGNVTATNEGNILTISDNANGIFAQSVGGGGGVGGAATAKGSGGSQSETMTLTGASGAGGNGGVVTANNSGNILTIGGDAAAIYAQSVGGGGGKAGSATTAGLPATTATLADWLPGSTSLKNSLQSYAGVQALVPGAWTPFDTSSLESLSSDYLAYAATQASNTADATQGSATVNMSAGGGSNGSGKGTAGDGQDVNVTNQGTLTTQGPMSAGIFAQSVGGGGGDAGSTHVQTLNVSGPNGMNGTVTLGGRAQNKGTGGGVSIHNLDAAIVTQGDASFGIFAQSVGGGGGHSTLTSSGFASVTGTPTTLTLGGDYDTQGDGGDVSVFHAIDASNKGAFINTSGNDAVAIVAQSIGGGGGDIVIMHTKANAGGYSVGTTDPTQDPSGSQTAIAVGGTNLPLTNAPLCSGVGDGYAFSGCGKGGNVTVTSTTASFNTGTGRNAHGILAQSIGGGGGWIVGLTYGGKDPFASKATVGGINYAKMGGNGGNVTVNVTGEVITGGAGAYGILAQSIGGGGVLGGDLASGGSSIAFPLDENAFVGPASNRWGSGGSVTVTTNGYLVQTKGANAPAIFAQSVGGGGGLMASTSGMMIGTAQGTGYAGPINITNNNGVIQALGNGSSAIVVNSEGHPDSGDNSLVSITNGGNILGNATAPVIVLSGKANQNGNGQISNNGLIAPTDANNNPVAGVAINVTDNAFGVVNNNAGGEIYGGIDVGAKGSINNAGYWGTSPSSTGDVVNTGTIDVNGDTDYTPTQSVINGALNNTTGTIKQAVDFWSSSVASLTAGKGVTLGDGGTILVVPYALASTQQILISNVSYPSAQYSVNVQDASNYLFVYNGMIDAQRNLVVNPISQMSLVAQQAGFGSNLIAVAQNLESQFADPSITHAQAQALAALDSSVTNETNYAIALTTLQSEGAQAASVAHVVASNAFVERLNSCPRFDDGAQFQREHDCLWGRVVASNGDKDAGNNSVGYHQNSQVFQLGGQQEVATDWFVGGSVSADNSNLDTRTVSDSVDGKGWTAGVAAKHQMGNWLVSAVLEGGQMSYDSRREAQISGIGGIAKASFDVSHWGLHSRISDQFAFQDWYLKPYIDLHATHIASDGYTERGAGVFDLKVAHSNTNVFGASPMVEAGSKFSFDNGMTLQVYGGIGATFYNQGRLGADMQFAYSSPNVGWFHVTSDLPQRRLKSTAGLDWKASDQWDLRLEYAGEFADHFQSNTGSLKATYRF
jgi:hypothetical protein